MDNILNTITAYREERKWSLYDLAAHAELKSSTISTWYNEQCDPDHSFACKDLRCLSDHAFRVFCKGRGK